MEPSKELQELFKYIEDNNDRISEHFYEELFKRCPDIEMKFGNDEKTKAEVFSETIGLIQNGSKDELLKAGRDHRKVKGLTRRNISYFSTSLFNILVDEYHNKLTRDLIRELNSYLDRAIFCIQEGYIQES